MFLQIYLVDILSIKFFDGQKNIFKALRSFRLLSLTPLLESYQETVVSICSSFSDVNKFYFVECMVILYFI